MLVLLSQNMDNDETSMLTHVIGAKPGDAAPLRIRAGWALAKIVQSSAFPDSNNTITVAEWESHLFHAAGSAAESTCSNGNSPLPGAWTLPKTRFLFCVLHNMQGTLEANALWKSSINGSSLILRFAVSEKLAAGEVVIVSVQFVNPWASQEAPQNVRIVARGLGDDS